MCRKVLPLFFLFFVSLFLGATPSFAGCEPSHSCATWVNKSGKIVYLTVFLSRDGIRSEKNTTLAVSGKYAKADIWVGDFYKGEWAYDLTQDDANRCNQLIFEGKAGDCERLRQSVKKWIPASAKDAFYCSAPSIPRSNCRRKRVLRVNDIQ